MSSNESISNDGNKNIPSLCKSQNYTSDVGRAVTDAVHERLRQNLVYCDNCKKKFIGNGIGIHKHFNKSHPTNVYCIYCPGKVFYYYKIKDEINESEKLYYHRCRDWQNK